MDTTEELVIAWFELLNCCQNVNQKEFKKLHDAYSSRWSRSGYFVQGEVAYNINQRFTNV